MDQAGELGRIEAVAGTGPGGPEALGGEVDDRFYAG